LSKPNLWPTARRLSGFILVMASVLMAPQFSAQAQPNNQEQPSKSTATTTLNVELTIDAENIPAQMRESVRAQLEIYQLNQQAAPRPFRLRYLHNQADKQIKTALEPFGYYQATIEKTLERQAQSWQARYVIKLGEPVTIATLNIELSGDAQDDQTFARVVNSLNLKQDTAFVHDDYEQAKNQLLSLATERGYFDAEWETRQADIDLDTNTVAIALHLNSGTRYQFGSINFSEAPVSEALLARYVDFAADTPFNTRELLDLQVALADSDYFATVEVDPRINDATDKRVPIAVELTPNQRNRYRAGLGYGTDTGARITLGLDRRWVNESGHRFNSLIRLSEVQSTGVVNYTIPGINPATDRYTIGAEVTDKSNEEQRAQLYRVGVSDYRKIGAWQRTYALNWIQEDFQFGQDLDGSSQFLIPSINLSIVQADNRTDVGHGYRFAIGARGGSERGGSDTDFITLTASTKYIYQFSDTWRFLGRTELGATYVDDFSQLSPSLRFFAGGDNSVRGYAYEQLGPQGSDGVVTGGRYLAVASAEVDYEFKPNWRVALFTDLGNAMLDLDESLKQSVGIGIRWVSPIGSVRLDLAQAIDEPSKPWRIHFTLGPDL